jgi:peptidoglycan/xylan/chitin deacetylase (PgdA/CDA1 family)
MQIEQGEVGRLKEKEGTEISSFTNASSMKICVMGLTDSEVQIIQNLLYPFRIEYVPSSKHSDLTISKGLSEPKEVESKKLILISEVQSDKLLENDHNDILVVPQDLLRSCSDKLQAVLDPKISLAYKLSTKLPFSYNLVPSSIRSKVLKRQLQAIDFDLLSHLSFEVARRKLVEVFSELGLILKRKRAPALLVTHDIDTEKGLERAYSLKQVETSLGISSTWFVVSHEYPIPKHIALSLSEGSLIGSHDMKHDGRLIHFEKQVDLVNRLAKSKERLGEIFERDITSFRAPLLQFNSRINSALPKAGYESDFSLPCWEPVHPSTMQGFGLEGACEFELNGIREHPLTLFQDHQVLNVLGLSTSTAVKFWMDQISLIRAFDGDIVLLIHPDYAFSEDLESYRKLMQLITSLTKAKSRQGVS